MSSSESAVVVTGGRTTDSLLITAGGCPSVLVLVASVCWQQSENDWCSMVLIRAGDEFSSGGLSWLFVGDILFQEKVKFKCQDSNNIVLVSEFGAQAFGPRESPIGMDDKLRCVWIANLGGHFGNECNFGRLPISFQPEPVELDLWAQ